VRSGPANPPLEGSSSPRAPADARLNRELPYFTIQDRADHADRRALAPSRVFMEHASTTSRASRRCAPAGMIPWESGPKKLTGGRTSAWRCFSPCGERDPSATFLAPFLQFAGKAGRGPPSRSSHPTLVPFRGPAAELDRSRRALGYWHRRRGPVRLDGELPSPSGWANVPPLRGLSRIRLVRVRRLHIRRLRGTHTVCTGARRLRSGELGVPSALTNLCSLNAGFEVNRTSSASPGPVDTTSTRPD
jgi:hypothetical protein